MTLGSVEKRIADIFLLHSNRKRDINYVKEKEVTDFLILVKNLTIMTKKVRHRVKRIKKENISENKVIKILFLGYEQDL